MKGFRTFLYLNEGVIDSKLKSKGSKLMNLVYGCAGKRNVPPDVELLNPKEVSANKKGAKFEVKSVGLYSITIKKLKDILSDKNDSELRNDSENEYGYWNFEEQSSTVIVFYKGDERLWIKREGSDLICIYTIGREDDPYVEKDDTKDEEPKKIETKGDDETKTKEPEKKSENSTDKEETA